MKLLIEEWVEKNLTEDAVRLMEEAVICYKVGAYRSAYLMSYLAFKTTVKNRILGAAKPDCIEDKFWNEQILMKLEDDDKWERVLNDIVAATNANGSNFGLVFRFTNYDRIKERYSYWKNIRNSCAHAKDEHISSSTVEQFWNYMQDDLPEFYVLGGKQYLLDKLCYDYKYFYTIGKEELEKILCEIPAVYKKNVQKCFEDFYERNEKSITFFTGQVEFWEVIVNIKNEEVLEGFLDFVYSQNDVFLPLYRSFPKLLYLITSRHKEFIQKYLAPLLEGQYYIDSDILWQLLVAVLKVGEKLINIDKVTSDYHKFASIKNINLEKDDMALLHRHKVFQKFLFNAGGDFFVNNSDAHFKYYNYASDKSDENIEQCFKYLEWDISVIEKMNYALEELDSSCEMRSNQTAIKFGKMRQDLYKIIFSKYKDEIGELIKNDLEKYVHVQEWLINNL